MRIPEKASTPWLAGIKETGGKGELWPRKWAASVFAPGANLSGRIALFEATHVTALKPAGQGKVNPGSLIVSAEMMLRRMGWNEAADLIIDGMNAAIASKTVTHDFERLMGSAKLLKCAEFGGAIIKGT